MTHDIYLIVYISVLVNGIQCKSNDKATAAQTSQNSIVVGNSTSSCCILFFGIPYPSLDGA